LVTPRRKSRANRRRLQVETPLPDRRSEVVREVVLHFAAQRRRLLVSVTNELIAENCFAARDAILRALDAVAIEQVVLNFENVPFVDSAAIGMLLELQKRLSARKKHLILANIPPQTELLLETLMLHGVFDVRTM
jgi:anti-anti-sigma factor